MCVIEGYMKKVEIYTDGACKGNPGPGGYGAILKYTAGQKLHRKEISGGETETTNNRMELMGAIKAFALLKEPCEVLFCSDSKYVVDGLSKGWAESWRKKGWKRADNKPALNPDLWEELLQVTAEHTITYVWVKGHAGHPENERCDELAVLEAEKFATNQNEEM